MIRGIVMFFVVSETVGLSDYIPRENASTNSHNYLTTESFTLFHTPNEMQRDETEIIADVLIGDMRNDTNISHLKTYVESTDWAQHFPKLQFPNVSSNTQYKVASLHLDKGIFVFDFLRSFLSGIQPYDVSADLVIDVMTNRMNTSKLISESLHLEAVLLAVIGLCCILCCVIPGTELWLACRPIREDYKPTRHPRTLTFLLIVFVFIFGIGMITMTICNEIVSASVEKFPVTIEAALQDLHDYHSVTTSQFRKCLSRSLDVASEAILVDLDNIEDLLGKPVQIELSTETGLDVALDTLTDLANTSQVLSAKVESLLLDGEKARSLGRSLNIEIEDLRRNLESALKACTGPDRSLCNIIDSSGLRLTLGMEEIVKDDRLLRLRVSKRENLTETVRQARGEYLYIPQHVTRYTLDIRNQIRREVNRMRARIFDEARNMEVSNTELVKKLEVARRMMDYATPYIVIFEHIRWLVGIGGVLCILPIWLLLLCALCCRCRSEDKVRPILLCTVFITCFISIALWSIFIMTLVLSSHTEMLVCRPLHDPNYHVMEIVLETQTFLGRRLTVPLKDILKKCRENEPAYPVYGLGNMQKIEQLTAYWAWSEFAKLVLKLKIEVKNLKIFTPSLQQQLQNLLYAYGLNLTEHRIMIQGPILKKDMEALSDQVNRVSRQMEDRLTARSLETISITMQDLTSRRLKPLMKLKDDLIYKLAGLDLQMQPLQRQVNQSISHLKTIQYYIDNQGDKIAQLKTKIYVERLDNYLDQWRSHVLAEMGSGVAKCRPLWDVLEGVRYLLCSHFLGNLSGYWFATLLCLLLMIASTPMAHILSLVYRKATPFPDDSTVQPIRSESPQTAVSEDETWQTPEPPPPPPQDGW
ncbi:prominin [Calliopsis andreniformis]|uniref:prominin n=1 Tax=Calliopsis andreniformis TaxID=337506 RepID=UPI003FCDBE1C